MVFNKAAKRLLETVGRLDVVLHDWWMYQLVSAVGGAIRYDPQPALKYRQHLDNLIGSNLGWRARLVRFRMMLSGRFRDWNTMNIAALQQVPAHLIKPQNRAVLQLFAKARTASSPETSLLSEAIRRLPPDTARQYRPACGNAPQKDLRWVQLLRSTAHEKPPEKSILVTGAAGFIGANFVLDWLGLDLASVVSLDKLTYAGNLDNLAGVANDSRHVFVHGDIGDVELVESLLKRYRPMAVVNFAAESHVDRSIHGPADFIATNVVGTFRLLETTRAFYESLEFAGKNRV